MRDVKSPWSTNESRARRGTTYKAARPRADAARGIGGQDHDRVRARAGRGACVHGLCVCQRGTFGVDCAHQAAGPELLEYGARVQSPSLGAPWGLEGEASAEAAGVPQRGLHGVPEKVLQVHRSPGEKIQQCVKWASL